MNSKSVLQIQSWVKLMKQCGEYQVQFEQHRQAYANVLPGKIGEIDGLWQKLAQAEWDTETFEKMRSAVHKLAGTGHSYGFRRVGRQALLLDQILHKVKNAGGVPSDSDRRLINSGLEKLRDQVCQQESGPVLADAAADRPYELIYVVDDDIDACRYYDVVLSTAGYRTRLFTDLDAFWHAMDEQKPDLIIMDIIFPEGDMAGVNAVKRLQSDVGDSIPIIFSSVRGDILARIEALRAGGCSYMPKPVEPETMLTVVSRNANIQQHGKRVLVIDDDPCALTFCETLLKKAGYTVKSIEQPEAILEEIETFEPDALVIDYHMPKYKGDELTRLLHQDERYSNLPVVMITADRDRQVEARIRELGNTRLLHKPVDNKRLLETLSRLIRSSLPVLPGHRETAGRTGRLLELNYFYSEVESVITAEEQSAQLYILLYVTIDDVASIRERVGLKRLNELEQMISGFLLTLVEKNELITRLNDFSYLVLQHVSTPSRLKDNIESINRQLANEVFHVDGIGLSVTASTGAVSISAKIETVDEAVNAAEAAAAKARNKGGNQVCIEVAGETRSKNFSEDVGNAFMEAYRTGGLRLHYQPIVNINTSESIYEAYSRFASGDQLLSPAQFMPFIEEYDLKLDFNKKLVIAAIGEIGKRDGREDGHRTLVVKLEPVRGSMSKFATWLENYLASRKMQVDNRLIFSFRESWVLQNESEIRSFINSVEKLGCGFALEHVTFTKYTSELIEDIRPAFVKLSPAFVSKLISGSPGDSVALLRKAQTMDITVVAGSIENADTFAKLMAHGIFLFQGYFVQQPGDNMDFKLSQYDF